MEKRMDYCCMKIQRPLLGLVLSFLFLIVAAGVTKINSAAADTVSAQEPVQIAQSDEQKPKEEEGEDDLGEDDC